MLAACRDPELVLADDVTMCAQLSSQVLLGPHIRDVLSFLEFDLQKDGAKDEDPFVVFPHWDYDGTLDVADKTLQAIHRKAPINTRTKLDNNWTLTNFYPLSCSTLSNVIGICY